MKKLSFVATKTFIIISIICCFANLIANEKPLLIKFNQKYYFPIFSNFDESFFLKENYLLSQANFHDPEIILAIKESGGWIVFPPIAFSQNTINFFTNGSALSSPNSLNLLGTDDHGRDLFARLIYGLRYSILFGLALAVTSMIIGIIFGAIQGYFGGLVDLFLQRFVEIWSSLPVMFLLLIISATTNLGFFYLLIILAFFNWMHIAGFVRAEFFRLRNLNFIKSAQILGAGNYRIIFKHILPNILPIIFATAPFLMASSMVILASLDFLGLNLLSGSASIGDILNQGKNNIYAYWLGLAAFLAFSVILILLILISKEMEQYFSSK